MKYLILLRGVSGCGKSTFIKNHNLENYTICIDNIRLLLQSPILDKDGKYNIPESDCKQAWKIGLNMLEQRMKSGSFSVIDATHIKEKDLNIYKSLSEQYNYKVYLVDFTNININIIKKQNLLREEYKQVPEYVIDRMYNNINIKIPSFIEVIKPEDFKFELSPIDLTDYKVIHHIGDVHGCFSILMKYIESFKKDEFYIFTGDYLDRGKEIKEMFLLLKQLIDLKNVILLEGNHENHLKKYAYDIEVKSSNFTDTKQSIEEFSKDDCKKIVKSFKDMYYYKYYDKTCLVTHGGISTLPSVYISSKNYIIGSGEHKDALETAQTFDKTGIYQIFGHRNDKNHPFNISERCFCLEDGVEKGGNLRCLDLNESGFKTIELKNI